MTPEPVFFQGTTRSNQTHWASIKMPTLFLAFLMRKHGAFYKDSRFTFRRRDSCLAGVTRLLLLFIREAAVSRAGHGAACRLPFLLQQALPSSFAWASLAPATTLSALLKCDSFLTGLSVALLMAFPALPLPSSWRKHLAIPNRACHYPLQPSRVPPCSEDQPFFPCSLIAHTPSLWGFSTVHSTHPMASQQV